MFSTRQHLTKRTGAYGVGRFNYLQSLVEEFQATDLSSSKREILANLANFAYDPINYDYFLQLNIPDMFIDCIVDEAETDPCVKLYALTAICNSCLDKRLKSFYLSNGCVKAIAVFLFWLLAERIHPINNFPVSLEDSQMIIQCITALMYLISGESRKEITSDAIQRRMSQLKASADGRVKNLATIFMEDYTKR